MQRRTIVRVIVLDGQRRVLMLRGGAGDEHYWLLPGGSVGPGETTEAAAVRAVRDETGLMVAPVGRDAVLERGYTVGAGEDQWRITETVRAARLRDADADPIAQADHGEIAWRWWTLDELRATAEPVQPDGLAELVAGSPPLPITGDAAETDEA